MSSSYRTLLHRMLAVGLFAAVVAIPVRAAQERPLPEATVVAPGGATAALSSFAADGQWLVLYIGPSSSAASARLLDAMSQWQLEAGLTRVLIVVADEKDLEGVAAQWREKLAGARWAADPKGEVAKGLKVRGAPTLIGVDGTTVRWVLAGVLNDPTALRDVIRSWTSGAV